MTSVAIVMQLWLQSSVGAIRIEDRFCTIKNKIGGCGQVSACGSYIAPLAGCRRALITLVGVNIVAVTMTMPLCHNVHKS